MGYPMSYSRVVNRNQLRGDYGTSAPPDDRREQALSLIRGDLRRLEADQRDDKHLAAYAKRAGVTTEQVRKILDDLFGEHDVWSLPDEQANIVQVLPLAPQPPTITTSTHSPRPEDAASGTYQGRGISGSSRSSTPMCECRICGTDTPMLGTKLCDPCWELERRITHRPDIARKILSGLQSESASRKIVERHRRHVELTAALEPAVRDYAIMVCDDILSDLPK